MLYSPAVVKRFWAKVDKNGPVPDRPVGLGPCWVWTASRNGSRRNYGQFAPVHARPDGAHRISWRLANGEIPAGFFVLHKCDNPPCVNPAHLFLGTQSDNLADMCAKARHFTGPMPDTRNFRRGEAQPNSKLTENQVRQIRTDPRIGELVAKDFGVTRRHVDKIRARSLWKHVK